MCFRLLVRPCRQGTDVFEAGLPDPTKRKQQAKVLFVHPLMRKFMGQQGVYMQEGS